MNIKKARKQNREIIKQTQQVKGNDPLNKPLHSQDTALTEHSNIPDGSSCFVGKEAAISGNLENNDVNHANKEKINQLEINKKNSSKQPLTTNQGTKVSDDQNSLKIGVRGPTLLEDFIMREKITHFDHERIPERIVHARGSAAHGYFELYKSLSSITKADFLQRTGQRTSVFVRFSTVQGSRGSADTVRDIRGWATKFYTNEGIFDLVGNNTPVFFIQDAIKFPDFVHALKPEPHNEIPQGASAHDSFWDFVSLQPETLHNVFWAMSDRGIPRSYRTMEGFGIHTFKFINAADKITFVRFHWKPVAGKASLLWDEAQKLAGKDADFHRRDLWEAIETGNYPEYELGIQLIPEEDEFKFDFDLLDPTKLIPENLVPVQLVGKMVLDRNPDNFFAETEQVAFHPGHIVPGLDFTNDPLLQGRLFSYTDTQISRLGGPNFHEIPINKPTCPYHNLQRDGMHRMEIDSNSSNYSPNSLSDNWPREVPVALQGGGFSSNAECIALPKIRQRSDSFLEYYSHPRFFWLSQTLTEQQHIVDAFSFELGKVVRPYIRERIVEHLAHIDNLLAQQVAKKLGLTLSAAILKAPVPESINGVKNDPALSLYAIPGGNVKGRIVAVLLTDNVCSSDVLSILQGLKKHGLGSKLLAKTLGTVTASDGSHITVDATFDGSPSITVDAVLIPSGTAHLLLSYGESKYFILEAYKHLKVIGLCGDAKRLKTLWQSSPLIEEGIVESPSMEPEMMERFIEALMHHRIWSRSNKAEIIPV